MTTSQGNGIGCLSVAQRQAQMTTTEEVRSRLRQLAAIAETVADRVSMETHPQFIYRITAIVAEEQGETLNDHDFDAVKAMVRLILRFGIAEELGGPNTK